MTNPPCLRCSAFLFDPPYCVCPDLQWYRQWQISVWQARIRALEAMPILSMTAYVQLQLLREKVKRLAQKNDEEGP